MGGRGSRVKLPVYHLKTPANGAVEPGPRKPPPQNTTGVWRVTAQEGVSPWEVGRGPTLRCLWICDYLLIPLTYKGINLSLNSRLTNTLSPARKLLIERLMVGAVRFLPLCALLLVLPAIVATQPQ
jgi:hypothetical protein